MLGILKRKLKDFFFRDEEYSDEGRDGSFKL